jgi:hypothetical protein
MKDEPCTVCFIFSSFILPPSSFNTPTPMNLATNFTELTSNEPSGPIASLAANLRSPNDSPLPDLPAVGPAASIVSAIGVAQQADPPSAASLAGLAQELQHEAARAELAQQHLAAQLQAAEHLGALTGAAQGGGLRVQIVGGTPPVW